MTLTLAFWTILALTFAVQRLWADTPERRGLVYGLAGAAGIALVAPPTAIQAIALAMGVAGILIGTRLIVRNRRMGSTLVGIGVILAIWLIGKTAQGTGLVRVEILFIGISYMLVKAWSLFKDMLDGKIERASPGEVLGYLLHLPTLQLGPMHQFTEFRGSLETPYRIDAARLIDCLFRIVFGLMKIQIVANLLAPAIPVTALLSGAFIYSIVLFCDFSGYCDIAIATSRLVGVDVPENFNWPFLASSMRDFWRRWHISFSRALTAHVFMPVSRALARRLPHSPALASALANIVTFAFCGYWHGATINFVLWGLWHAFGLIVQDASARRMRRAGLRPGMNKSPIVKARDIVFTFAFVSIGWIFFALPIMALGRIVWSL